MLFRLVTIIYFTILCHSLTHTSLFSIDEILDQHSSANVFGQSPPAGHMRVWVHTRLIFLTRKLPKKRHGL